MSRWIGLLLTLNLGVLLAGMAMQYWSPAERVPLVFNAEKIRLLSLPAVVVAPKPPPTQGEIAVDPNSRCLSWASLDAAGLMAIASHLEQIGIAADAYDIELENVTEKKLGWWVFLPPTGNDAALQAMIDEVRRLGVADYAPVRGGPLRNALSLGAFAKLAQAREHAARLAAKGIKDVRFGPRPESGAARMVFSDQIADSALPKSGADWPGDLRPSRCASP